MPFHALPFHALPLLPDGEPRLLPERQESGGIVRRSYGMDFTSLSDDKLSTLILEAQGERQARHDRRKAELLESFRSQAEALGLDPAKLAAALSKRGSRPRASSNGDGRSTVKPKYWNPKDHAERWAGRGAKPKWYDAHLTKGGKPDDMLIPENAI
jgi:DNA-binding protein H-NS